MAEFGIHRVETRDNIIDVAGRAYKGTFKRGGVFRRLLPGDRTVCLVVERIVAYGRDLDEVDEGLTALVSLSGEGGDLLADGSVLVTAEAP